MAPLFWITSRFFSRRIKEISREKQRRSGSISTSIEQTLSTMPLVHAFDAGEREVARYREEAEAKYRAEMASARLRSWYAPTLEMIELLGALAVIGAGAWQLAKGRLTVGELLAFLTFLSRLYGPVRGLGSTVTAAYSAAAGAERVLELLAQETMPADRPGAVTLERPRGHVRVEHVGFTYGGQPVPALADVSLTLRPGEVTAIVGASGAGKTTLARLLLRGLDPTTAGSRLTATTCATWPAPACDATSRSCSRRRCSSTAPCATTSPTGDPTPTTRRSGRRPSWPTPMSSSPQLPAGYLTRVGERGRRLSGGQAQRIAIARALLCDAPVLLLDEPTASLDSGSTDRVLAPMSRLMAGRSTLVISHNLLAAERADQVLVLDAGRVVERGVHDDLLAIGGTYARLWALARGRAAVAS